MDRFGRRMGNRVKLQGFREDGREGAAHGAFGKLGFSGTDERERTPDVAVKSV